MMAIGVDDLTKISGTDSNDIFHGGPQVILSGGLGNDLYYLWDPTAVIDEKWGEGIDTAYAYFWDGVKLADNVENLYLMSPGSTWAVGNASANQIHAGTVGASLDGAAGNDILFGGIGADAFRISAGNGSDTIVGFTSGYDSIILSGYGFSSFQEIRDNSWQMGSDVGLNLRNGETLTLRDTVLGNLTAADFGYSNVGNAAPDGYTPMSGAGLTWVQSGVYVANNVWNPGTYVEGKDYVIDSYWSTNNLTEGTTFNWAFPTTTDPYAPVRAYPEIIFGVSPFGDTVNATDSTQTFPVRVSDIEKLTATYDTSYSGTMSGFNVSYDIWLTSEPNGDGSTVTNEIMVWTHKHDFMPWGDMIGTFADGEFRGKIYHTGTYTAIILDKDVPAGTLDIVAVLDRLEELGVVSDKEWLASVQFGAEVISGVGSLTVNKFELALTTDDGVNDPVNKLIDGTGTTVVAILPEDAPNAPEPLPYDPIYDRVGGLLGYKEETFDDVGDQLIKWYDDSGKLVMIDSVKIPENGNIFTEHRDADGKTLWLDGTVFNDNGSITYARYDAQHSLLKWDIATSGADGTVVTVSYDSTGAITGSKIDKNEDGVHNIFHYSADQKLLYTEVLATDQGRAEAMEDLFDLFIAPPTAAADVFAAQLNAQVVDAPASDIDPYAMLLSPAVELI